jgi:hypothetical protein
VEVLLDEIFDSFLKIFWLVLHVESSPVDSLDILEPFVSDELIPHGQTNPCAGVRLEDADPVPLVSEDHANVVTIRIGKEPLYFGEGVVISEQNYISSLAISRKLLLCGVAMLHSNKKIPA